MIPDKAPARLEEYSFFNLRNRQVYKINELADGKFGYLRPLFIIYT